MNQKDSSDKELDLGERTVSVMNHSDIMTLPKPFTKNYLKHTRIVRVTMSHDGRLTLTPVKKENSGGSKP